MTFVDVKGLFIVAIIKTRTNCPLSSDRKTNRQKAMEPNKQADTQENRQTDRKTITQTHRKTDKQTGKP